MSDLTVTGTAEIGGREVTGSATAEVLDGPPGITETIDVEVNAARLLAFAELVERHAGAIRRDLEQFTAGHRRKHHEAAAPNITINVTGGGSAEDLAAIVAEHIAKLRLGGWGS